MKTMRLWTVHSLYWFNQLQERKKITGAKNHIKPAFLEGYNWMVHHMEKKIGGKPFHDCYPVWAWQQWNGIDKSKPDLRYAGHLPKGTHGVRLEIEKRSEEVVLSDFDLWHTPLWFRTYIGSSEKDRIQFENKLREMNCLESDYDQLPSKFQKKIRESWVKIFDLNFSCDNYTCHRNTKAIQATFWVLKLNEIKKVEYFIAR